MQIRDARGTVEKVARNIGKVIQGKDQVVSQALACWLAGGHILFEDVPGTGKTMLARAMARSINVDTKRIQFTPDLLPSDIIGSYVYAKDKGQFIFVPGPIFTGVLLSDELNRATPRTQAALLQAMAEGECTCENQTFRLSRSFIVIATQNPIEQHGTFPLPEAELDRFMMRISLGYPDNLHEKKIVVAQLIEHPIESLTPVVDENEWHMVRELAKRVKVSQSVLAYALALVEATRKHPEVALGCSPRATIALIRAGQSYSLIAGLEYIKPDFIKYVASAVLEHRLVLAAKARLEGVKASNVIRDVILNIPVPTKQG